MKQLLYAPDIIHVVGGTVSAPSISFGGDTDTGFYRSASGEVSFTSNGTRSLSLGAGGLITGAAATSSLILAGHVTGGVAAQRDIVLRTGNAANPQVLVDRVTVGSNGATAVLTLANVTVTGLDITAGQTIIFGTTGPRLLQDIGNQRLIIYGYGNGAGDGAILMMYDETTGDTGSFEFYTPGAGGTTDVRRLMMAGSGATTQNLWENSYHVGLKFGLAGTATGAFTMDGATSGVVTVTVAAVAGTWTMTLPAAVGAVGQQLTDAGGNGVTSWAAASLGEWKNDLGILDPHEALRAVVSAPTHKFTYNKNVMPAGQWDGNGSKMAGVFAEEAPWAMHGERDGYRSGIAFSNVNAFGYARAAIQALYEDFQAALARIIGLESELTALKGA